MDHAYSDILGANRPVHQDDAFSRRHPKMPRLNRAKLFAPFAALSGFDEAVRSKEVPYEPRHIPDAGEARALDAALRALYRATRTGALARQNRVRVRVEYFVVCADARHDACGRLGLYRVETGVARKVDPVGRVLLIGDKAIPFADIRAITGIDAPCPADATPHR